MRCKSAPDSKNQEVRIPIQSAHTNHRHRGRGSQEPATRSSSPQNTVTNQETEKGAEAGGVTSTGDERRQWRRMSRGSAGEESERGSHRAGPPKMKATRRGGGCGDESDVYDGERRARRPCESVTCNCSDGTKKEPFFPPSLFVDPGGTLPDS
jgi:hypothetical protein